MEENLIQDDRPLILVVDDELDIREFISMEFMDSYNVLDAKDGVEGCKKLKKYSPDLVITDLMMPNMGGVEFCRLLKNDPETDHIPVIMLTAKSDMESQLEGLDCGADDYVTKPFKIVLLKARVNNLLQNRRKLCDHFMQLALADGGRSLPPDFKDRGFINKLTDILKSRYSDWNFGADDLAKDMGMSLRTLQRKLKILVNRSPAEFITDFRMKRACELLEDSSQPITEVSFAVGYDESSSFSRAFKRQFNISPSEYRQARI